MKSILKLLKNRILLQISRSLLVTVSTCAFCTLTTDFVQAQSIIYVDASATGSANGTSWSDAYTSVQSAINAANSSDVIAIAGGIYHPGAAESDYLIITGARDGLKIYGGWAGTETFSNISDLKSQLKDRDFSTNPTIISGDIDGNDTKNAAGVTLTADDISGDNSDHIFYLDGFSDGKITAATVIDGLTITGGQADGSSAAASRGGGLYCYGPTGSRGCGPTLINLIFAGNLATSQGGALYNEVSYSGGGSMTILNTVFSGNEATFGGAIYSVYSSSGTVSLSILNTVFTENSGLVGRVMYLNGLNSNTTISIINTTVARNYTGSGAFIYFVGNGSGVITITNSIINNGNTGYKELYNTVSPTLSYTFIKGGISGSHYGQANIDGGGNRDNDPLFKNSANPAGDDGVFGTGDDGLQLQNISPALEMGGNSALPADTFDLDGDGNTSESIPYDITGADRIRDTTVDPGAYEAPADEAEIIYVDDDATGAADGTSWTNAYTNLQSAIDRATYNDVIAMAAGIYYPTTGTDVNSRFTIIGTRNGMKIYGGWSGAETFTGVSDLQSRLGNRNFANATILSGDIDHNDIKNSAGITLTTSGIVGNNTKNIFYLDGVQYGGIYKATVLDGLTITGGHANSIVGGGGIHCYGYGSGHGCNPTISNVAFIGNLSDQAGGAIYNRGDYGGDSSPIISNAVFAGNSATYHGGAIYNNGTVANSKSNPIISNSTFTGNSATYGGAVFNNAGYSGSSNPVFTNVIMYGDTATSGISSVNEIYNNSGAVSTFNQTIVKGFYGFSNSLDFDPQFVNADNLDGDDGVFGTSDDGLRLKPGSSAIDAGDNSVASLSSTDITGRQRILGTAVDLGAYEGPVRAKITGGEGWRMMTSPADGLSYGTLLDTLWTQGFTGADSEGGTSNVYTWDEASQQFISISDASEIPASGSGFLVYVFNDQNFDGTPDGFPKILTMDSARIDEEISPELGYTDTGMSGNDGWNLAGNPYGQPIDWDAASGWTKTNLDNVIYVWSGSADGGNGAYLSWNGTDGTLGSGMIAPWQGFWVKANAASPSFSLNGLVRSSGGAFYKKVVTPRLQFTLSDEDQSSKAIVMFSGLAQFGKDPLDAYKLQSLNTRYLNLFTRLKDGTALDINAIPDELDEPVALDMDIDGSNLNGAFDLSWVQSVLPDNWQFLLTDNQTGEKIDLKKQSSYSFQLSAPAKTNNAPLMEETEARTLEYSDGTHPGIPLHTVLKPKVLKAKGQAISRFTLSIIPGTAVSAEPTDELPTEIALDQNYPNPFNPSTVIRYQLPVNSEVQLRVYDLLGRDVATLINGRVKAGYHQVVFDARNLASGVYIYRLVVADKVISKKLTLIK